MRSKWLAISMVLFSCLHRTCETSTPNTILNLPCAVPRQQPDTFGLSQSACSQSYHSSSVENSDEESDPNMEESEGETGNSSRKTFSDASKFPNELTKVEDNFISRMLERCWEPLPCLKIPRRCSQYCQDLFV